VIYKDGLGMKGNSVATEREQNIENIDPGHPIIDQSKINNDIRK
jgi:hypothetical protein